MRVLILSRRGVAKAFTGDSTQMRRTISCLRSSVGQITQVFVDNDGSLYDEDDSPLDEQLSSLCSRHDVAHQLPRLNFRAHKAIQQYLSKIPTVISTVYWHDITRVKIAWRNNVGFKDKFWAAVSSWRAGTKYLQDYRIGCDIILPNSWAEGENVKKHFRLAPYVLSVPVPNAIDLPTFEITKLKKPSYIPFEEYVVCPAVFATRKNQLGLIKALKDECIPVVFIGGTFKNAQKYWNQCQRLATKQMLFVPHMSNTSEEYWSILRHARCACLPSDCETPGIALLEAAFSGARPVVSKQGGTSEYYGFCCEYFDPLDDSNIRGAIKRAWDRGRLLEYESNGFSRFSWEWCAKQTLGAYHLAIQLHK